jgi:hypothetical protein
MPLSPPIGGSLPARHAAEPSASEGRESAVDLYCWAHQQAAHLAEHNVSALDFAGLAAELDAFAANLRSEASRAVRVLLECGIRLCYGPAGEHRVAQKVSLSRGTRLRAILERSPSLLPWLEGGLPAAWQKARSNELDDYQRCGIAMPAVPSECPWSFTQLMVPDFRPATRAA